MTTALQVACPADFSPQGLKIVYQILAQLTSVEKLGVESCEWVSGRRVVFSEEASWVGASETKRSSLGPDEPLRRDANPTVPA